MTFIDQEMGANGGGSRDEESNSNNPVVVGMNNNNNNNNNSSSSNNVIENKNVYKGISIANRRTGFDASSLGLQTCTDFFMVTPGISPSELLASPVMLPNAQAQSSPTTGCFSSSNPESSRLGSTIKPLEEYFAKSEECSNMWEVDCLQQQQQQQPNCKINNRNYNKLMSQYPNQEQKQAAPQQQKCWEDGFLWRKYGQKQVKGSEFPRSYYKCTSSNCDVTKKVERSLDGQISEIVYKGSHNHPPLKKMNNNSNNNNNHEIILKNVVGSHDLSTELGSDDPTVALSMDESPPPPPPPCMFDNDEVSPESMSNEGGEDDHTNDLKRRKMRESLPVGPSHETSGTARSGQEPKIVLQIKSEIDILEDGYRWRKYGQKVVKGNPNPRSYYKCTTPDCLVRKHVERAADDIKSVVITYEGKHNHEVPSSRTSTSTSVVMSVDNITPLTNPTPTLATPSLSSMPLPIPISIPHKSVVSHVQDQLPLYMHERKPTLNYNEFMTTNLTTTFGPPIYPYSFSSGSHSLSTYTGNPFIMNSNIPLNNYKMVNPDYMSMSLPLQTNHAPVSSSNVSFDPNFHYNNYVPPMPPPSGQCQQIKEEHENHENKSDDHIYDHE